MGYRSQVTVKTTTEGYLLIRKKDNELEKSKRLLPIANIGVTPEGFYRINIDEVKWYDSYDEVKTFMNALSLMEEYDIPYKFIRIGEDEDDVEFRENYTDDMPDQICDFSLDIGVYDTDDCNYEDVEEE